jgi:hypothetical protein
MIRGQTWIRHKTTLRGNKECPVFARRQQQLLLSPSLRFSIQTGNSLPIFIPRIETGQDNPNRTVYRLTIRNPSQPNLPFNPVNEATAFLHFESWNLTAAQPQPPTTKQDLSSEYYFVE